jgi:hypothetical protein
MGARARANGLIMQKGPLARCGVAPSVRDQRSGGMSGRSACEVY